MKPQISRNSALALFGLGALVTAIVACTSFSPDDTKILYPSLDAASGAIGMAVYNRETKKSEMLFVPIKRTGDSLTNQVTSPELFRGHWLDNRRVVLAWSAGNDDEEGLSIATLPVGGGSAFKQYQLPHEKDQNSTLTQPLSVVGDRLFLMQQKTNLARLHLDSGIVETTPLGTDSGDFLLLPGLDGKSLFYLGSTHGADSPTAFGRLDPVSLKRTPVLTFTNEFAEHSFYIYDARGRTLAFLGKSDDSNELVVLRAGKPEFRRTLGTTNGGYAFGNAAFNRDVDRLWATFRKEAGSNSVAYGLMEIPLSDAPTTETILFTSNEADKSDAVMYFQAGFSHDGKTAAISTAYLACAGSNFKPGNCALFLIDLAGRERKVTRVEIPLPANHPDFK